MLIRRIKVLKKIYLSLNDNYTPNENFIFPFIQKNRISASKINQIEENIVPNKSRDYTGR